MSLQSLKHVIWSIVGLASFLSSAASMADVVPVVSPESTVAALNRIQLADIFLGRATRFPDGSQAVPIDQAEGTVARDEFYSKFAGKTAAQLKAYWSKIIFTGRGQPPKAALSSGDIKKLLAQNPHAIGYIESKQVGDTLRVVTVTQQ